MGAALLLVFSNGPVLRLAGWLDRPGLWNDWAVWPFFAGAAAASAVLAWAVRRHGGRAAGPAGREVPSSRALMREPPSRAAMVAIAWYSAAAVASSLWSVYPSATLWRSIVYLGLALLGLALAGLTDDELSTALVLLASVAVAGSLAVIVLQHDVGTDRHGNWIGMYTNRNSLAPLAALGVIAGLRWLLPRSVPLSQQGDGSAASGAEPVGCDHPPRGRHRQQQAGAASGAEPAGCGHSAQTTGTAGVAGTASSVGRRAWGALLVAASLATLMGAGSRTAWLALAAALVAVSALGASRAGAPRMRLRGPWRRGATVLGGASVVVGMGVAVVMEAWNVPTFSQRRTIWSLVWDRVLERPWRGHGFFAFWEVPELVAEHDLLELGSAHNSLVETALGLGVLGTAPLVVLAVLAAVNAGRGLWLRPSADTGMWAAVTVFVLVENMTESFVLWFSHIWVLLLVAALRRSAPAIGAASPAMTAPVPATQSDRPNGAAPRARPA